MFWSRQWFSYRFPANIQRVARSNSSTFVIGKAKHRACKPGHWFRRDHSELLQHEIERARRRGPAALQGLLRALEAELRKEASAGSEGTRKARSRKSAGRR
jgi:hypothetical protein